MLCMFTVVKLLSRHSPHENLVVFGYCQNQAEFFNSICHEGSFDVSGVHRNTGVGDRP